MTEIPTKTKSFLHLIEFFMNNKAGTNMSKQKIITIIICCITIALVITSAIVISGRFKQNNIPSNNDASIQGINQCDLSIIKEDGENKIFNYTKAFDLESLENETMQVQTTNGLITHIKISGNALVSKTEQEKFDLNF